MTTMKSATTLARSGSTALRRTRQARVLRLACGLALLGSMVLAPMARGDGRGHGHGGHGGHGYYHPRSYFSFSFGYPFYSPYYYPYWGYYGYYGYPGPAYVAVSPDMGAIHLAVKPKKAAVYLDGQYIGLVKNYDGYPRYLWLQKGDHQLVFYLEGYRTHAETVRVQPGAIMKLKYPLTVGAATPPETLFESAPATAESSAPAPSPRQPSAAPAPAPSASRDESWRERGTVQQDVRATPGQLRLRIEPGDAVVYLDGRLVGSGDEITRLHGPLVVDPGRHTVEVTRPGYRTRSLEVEAAAGEEVWLEVTLEPTDR